MLKWVKKPSPYPVLIIAIGIIAMALTGAYEPPYDNLAWMLTGASIVSTANHLVIFYPHWKNLFAGLGFIE